METGPAGRGRSRRRVDARGCPRGFDLWWRVTAVIALGAFLLVARSDRDRFRSTAANAYSAPTAENPMAHMVHPTLAAYKPDAPTLQPEGWMVQASSQSAGHPPVAVLDDHLTTYWSSKPSSSLTSALPQSITIDMRGPQIVSGVTYQPRGHPSGGCDRPVRGQCEQ